MNMDALYDIRDMLCKELDEIARKGEMSAGDLEVVHKLTGTIKNIDKIERMEDGEYSRDGDWMADIRGTYGRGSSYRRHRDSMGRYARSAGKDRMKDQLRDMMRDADDEKSRDAIRRCMELIG